MMLKPILPLALLPVLLLAGCDKADHENSGASVTMKLPPAHPADPRPGFSSISNTDAPETAQ